MTLKYYGIAPEITLESSSYKGTARVYVRTYNVVLTFDGFVFVYLAVLFTLDGSKVYAYMFYNRKY